MKASFEEKSVWIQLGGLSATLIVYFYIAGKLLSAGVTLLVPFVPIFAIATALLVGLLVFGHIVAAAVARPERHDERDRLIAWRAEHNSSWILAVGVLSGVACMVLGIGTVWIANWLIFTLFLSEIAKLVFQIIYYRRGTEG